MVHYFSKEAHGMYLLVNESVDLQKNEKNKPAGQSRNEQLLRRIGEERQIKSKKDEEKKLASIVDEKRIRVDVWYATNRERKETKWTKKKLDGG